MKSLERASKFLKVQQENTDVGQHGMAVPTVHLNGTSGEDLLDQVTEASEAAYGLINALTNMSPNGRDYYIQGPEALRQAEQENNDRISRVKQLRQELEDLAEAIANQMG